MITNIIWLIIVVFIIEELIRHKINMFEVFQEADCSKLSSKRVGMLASIGLFIWIGKELISAEAITYYDIIIFAIVGLFAFFPNAARELIAKFIDNKKETK